MMLETLREVRLFANLLDRHLHWFSKQGREVWLNPGDFLFIEGDPVENFDVLLEGELEITKHVNGQEIVLTIFQAGTFTYEIPLLAGTVYIVSARALSKSHLLRFRADTFPKMLLRCFPIASVILYTFVSASKVLGLIPFLYKAALNKASRMKS
ncbi:MAG: cyclic nucleotide-binding domain-containing protein [Hassallia sp. WJT32-NPBG1]|jgi:CRP-like cAMP-binding protein|nr:cyclic nucleotide-binding domain-containing protein [Hassallia sp. WJT32-NPBG1]